MVGVESGSEVECTQNKRGREKGEEVRSVTATQYELAIRYFFNVELSGKVGYACTATYSTKDAAPETEDDEGTRKVNCGGGGVVTAERQCCLYLFRIIRLW